MRSKIGYYCVDYECIDDVGYPFEDEFDDDIVYWIEQCAEFAWNNNDGWEWMKGGCRLALVVDGKEVGIFDIEVELKPMFWAREVKTDEEID